MSLNSDRRYAVMGHGSPEYLLLTILQHHAPTGTAQQQCTDVANGMARAGWTSIEIEIALAEILVEGLRNEDWPWKTAVTDERN